MGQPLYGYENRDDPNRWERAIAERLERLADAVEVSNELLRQRNERTIESSEQRERIIEALGRIERAAKR